MNELAQKQIEIQPDLALVNEFLPFSRKFRAQQGKPAEMNGADMWDALSAYSQQELAGQTDIAESTASYLKLDDFITYADKLNRTINLDQPLGEAELDDIAQRYAYVKELENDNSNNIEPVTENPATITDKFEGAAKRLAELNLSDDQINAEIDAIDDIVALTENERSTLYDQVNLAKQEAAAAQIASKKQKNHERMARLATTRTTQIAKAPIDPSVAPNPSPQAVTKITIPKIAASVTPVSPFANAPTAKPMPNMAPPAGLATPNIVAAGVPKPYNANVDPANAAPAPNPEAVAAELLDNLYTTLKETYANNGNDPRTAEKYLLKDDGESTETSDAYNEMRDKLRQAAIDAYGEGTPEYEKFMDSFGTVYASILIDYKKPEPAAASAPQAAAATRQPVMPLAPPQPRPLAPPSHNTQPAIVGNKLTTAERSRLVKEEQAKIKDYIAEELKNPNIDESKKRALIIDYYIKTIKEPAYVAKNAKERIVKFIEQPVYDAICLELMDAIGESLGVTDATKDARKQEVADQFNKAMEYTNNYLMGGNSAPSKQPRAGRRKK